MARRYSKKPYITAGITQYDSHPINVQTESPFTPSVHNTHNNVTVTGGTPPSGAQHKMLLLAGVVLLGVLIAYQA